MPKLNRIISDKTKLLETADVGLMKEIKKIEAKISKMLNVAYDNFSSTGGVLINDMDQSTTTNKAKGRHNNGAIVASKYPKAIQEFLPFFEQLETLNVQLHKTLNKKSIKKLIGGFKAEAIERLSANLVAPKSIEASLVMPIRKVMFEHVTMGIGLKEAKSQLNTFIAGSPEANGHMSRYVNQVATDALNQYDGTVNQKVAQEFGFNAYAYVGSLIKTSREQCIRWINEKGGTLMMDELQSEIDWALANGSGYSAYTPISVETFSVYRGGHNCRHQAIPFDGDNADSSKMIGSL